jgi:hypothetical protein
MPSRIATPTDMSRLRDQYRNNLYKYGRNPSISTTEEIIWDGGDGFYGFLSAATTVTVESGSADDAVGGGGATSIQITGIGEDGCQSSEYIALNGVTPVISINKYSLVFRMRILAASGSATEDGDPFTGPNHGAITCKSTGAGTPTMAIITAATGQTLMAIWQCPLDKWGELKEVHIYPSGDDSVFTTNTLYGKLLYQVIGSNAWNAGGFVQMGREALEKHFALDQLILPGTKIILTSYLSGGGPVAVAGDFEIKLHDIQP